MVQPVSDHTPWSDTGHVKMKPSGPGSPLALLVLKGALHTPEETIN